jgi:nucleotide-binding universal stress UspA family protein
VYSCIVVGTDGSDTAAEAVRQAAELARIHGARLHLVSAYSPTLRAKLQAERELLPEEERWMASPGEQAERVLTEAAKAAEASGIAVETHSLPGDPAEVIIELAENLEAELVVVGNKGMTGITRFLLGSVPSKVAHHASCSVLIVRTT